MKQLLAGLLMIGSFTTLGQEAVFREINILNSSLIDKYNQEYISATTDPDLLCEKYNFKRVQRSGNGKPVIDIWKMEYIGEGLKPKMYEIDQNLSVVKIDYNFIRLGSHTSDRYCAQYVQGARGNYAAYDCIKWVESSTVGKYEYSIINKISCETGLVYSPIEIISDPVIDGYRLSANSSSQVVCEKYGFDLAVKRFQIEESFPKNGNVRQLVRGELRKVDKGRDRKAILSEVHCRNYIKE